MDAGGAGCGPRQGVVFPCVLVLCLVVCAQGDDWPQYRGGPGNGVSTDRIQRQWTGSITNPVWRVAVPNCLGSVVVSGGRLLTQTVRSIDGTNWDACIALNPMTGAELWATPLEETSYPHGGVGWDDGPRSTPTVAGDSVYILSSYLKLFRLDAATGAVRWVKDLKELYGAQMLGWQNAASPVFEDGLIFLNANCSDGVDSLMAFNAQSGSLVWRTGHEWMTHSTPRLATIHGVRQIIYATWAGLTSVEPRTGRILWRQGYPFLYSGCIGVTPVVYEDLVFITGAHAYEMGSVVMQASLTDATWSTRQVWWTNNPTAHWMTPVVHEGFVYGQFGIQQMDSVNAQLMCVDMRTGAVRWKADGFGRGSTLLVDGLLLVLTERGHLVLARPNPNAYEELGRFVAISNYNGTTNKCWNSPAICDGRVYVRSTALVACFDLSWPALQLEPPRPDTTGLQLTIRTTTGAPIDNGRLTGLEVRASSDLASSLAAWPRLTNALILTNGVVRINRLSTGPDAQRFFIVNEPR